MHRATGREAVLSGRELTFVMVALFASMLLSALDQTIFGTTLPTIVGDLHGVDQMLWVTTAYLLTVTITMPVYGKLADLVGQKPLLFSALGFFLAGSILGGLASNMSVLILARAVQGLGGGGLMVMALAIVAAIVPPRKRAMYMGILGSVWSVASVLGPILGGWFAQSVGWRWAFWLNLPIALLACVLVLVFLRAPLPHKGRTNLDIAGMATMALGTTALILVISWGGRQYSWGSPLILGLGAGFLVLAALFLFIESRAQEPIIPLDLFLQRNFNLATAGAMLISIAFMGVILYMPTYLQMVTGLSPTNAGLLLVPLALGVLVASVGAGAVTNRTGHYKWMPPVSAFLIAVSLYLLSTLTVDSPVWLACLYLFIHGAGNGLGLQTLNLIVQTAFPPSRVGTATGSFSFFRQIGAALGSAVVGTLFTRRLVELLSERMPGAGSGMAGSPDANSLTPAAVAQLPEKLKVAVMTSYNEALTPVYRYLVPLALLALVLFAFVVQKPLAVTNEPARKQR